ncbi:MAG: hypothetical protein H7Y22_17725 [Gemmatimonadaceae bacterium]|nr:hypothetical protein [Gloeobacterales cyanobacterium ES-bin-141]
MDFRRETMERAVRAVQLSPLTLEALEKMGEQSVSLSSLGGVSAQQAKLTHQTLSELAVESELMWLFRVGVVRREVDGQGITDCFRLTPLGHQVLTSLRQAPVPALSLLDQVHNTLARWLP